MTEVRVSPIEQVAVRRPLDSVDGRNWLCWIFRDDHIDASLLTDAEVDGWEIVWPPECRS